jgi:hypothetical protein
MINLAATGRNSCRRPAEIVDVDQGVYRLSKRAVPDVMRDLFGLSMSVGAVIGCQQKASEALAATVDEAMLAVAAEPVKHIDETGWREARGRAWLWVVVTAKLTVFMVHLRRNADAAQALLGKAAGVLVTDRHGAHGWWPGLARQFCWAHLIRDFKAIAERGCASERIGNALLDEASRMFAWWHRVRDGTLTRSTFKVYMRDLRRRVEDLLAEGGQCAITVGTRGRTRRSSAASNRCGPSSASTASSRPTTSPNAPSATPCSGASRAVAPIRNWAAASSNGS